MKKFAFAVAATLAFGAAQAATNPPAAPAANNLPNPTAVLKTAESAVKDATNSAAPAAPSAATAPASTTAAAPAAAPAATTTTTTTTSPASN